MREPDRHLPVPRDVEANGPVQDLSGQAIGAALATGRTLVVAPQARASGCGSRAGR